MKAASGYSGGAVREASASTPSENSLSIASPSRASSMPRASARAARAFSSRFASGAMSLRFPNAIEWRSSRPSPLAEGGGELVEESAPTLGAQGVVVKVRSETPRPRIASNSGWMRGMAPRRSRCTRHRWTPWRDSWWAVARPNRSSRRG